MQSRAFLFIISFIIIEFQLALFYIILINRFNLQIFNYKKYLNNLISCDMLLIYLSQCWFQSKLFSLLDWLTK